MKEEEENPWEHIELTDYENHMRLDSVGQLQALDEIMKSQFEANPGDSIMILGIAGGNGLRHIDPAKCRTVYGVDINESYLRQCGSRYPQLASVLKCICADLTREETILPHADMVVADLLIEYVGYDCFRKTIARIAPLCVSCVIQVNTNDGFVSDSPYLRVFDGLGRVHHSISEEGLDRAMRTSGYRPTIRTERSLPNGKKLIRMDFEPIEPNR